jgi:serine/threonine-protein kinase HipA
LLERYAGYSGISGMQPKVLLRSDEAPLDKVTFRSTTHIVKSFDPREFPELAANEYFCTRAAAHAGLPVAKLSLSENRRLLVAERFDLRTDGSYLGVEDFCVLNALPPGGRYNGSYEDIARRIRQYVSTEHVSAALEQFFLTVALSCGIENGDAHLKNFAVTYQNAESPVRLAPAYDLVCTTLYQPRDSLALTLGGSKAFPQARTLVAFAVRHCDQTAAKARKLLQSAADGIRRAREEIRAYARKHPDFAKAGDGLSNRFERGLRRLTLAA